jgi:hypothetical protein
MKIRAITVGCEIGDPFDAQTIANAGRFLKRVRAAYEAQGILVQTARFATQPCTAWTTVLSDRVTLLILTKRG